MLDNQLALLGLRTQLKTVLLATTGVIELEATSNGYGRSAGSFITDGFLPGMELLPVGFDENKASVIQSVTEDMITTRQVHPSEPGAGGRSLLAGLPSLRSWENRSLMHPGTKAPQEPDKDLWYFEEEYIPGVPIVENPGPTPWVSEEPIYMIRLYAISGIGSAALYKMADAILRIFSPRIAMTLADGTVLRIRSIPGPYRGQVRQTEKRFANIVVTIPLWVRTQNI